MERHESLSEGSDTMDAQRRGREEGFDAILERIRVGRESAWRAVNEAMIATYHHIGSVLSRRFGEAGWEQSDVDACAEWLIARGAGAVGFSEQNLSKMRSFYDAWANAGGVPKDAFALPWACHLVLLELCSSNEERCWYMQAALQGAWSADTLEARIRAGSPIDGVGSKCDENAIK